ncbi:hypothetical protein B0I35DRAFT_414102 [Stachybotrys elegans]|uniref:Uncharacterized protein n=1 Tax=Stachybotrys elegans TaxID=80388 RepID=A0A8K0SJA1_9HYPO|nr:hypothetical protein B0I35DRAFT_414102 [Stachybotrys elegans]
MQPSNLATLPLLAFACVVLLLRVTQYCKTQIEHSPVQSFNAVYPEPLKIIMRVDQPVRHGKLNNLGDTFIILQPEKDFKTSFLTQTMNHPVKKITNFVPDVRTLSDVDTALFFVVYVRGCTEYSHALLEPYSPQTA